MSRRTVRFCGKCSIPVDRYRVYCDDCRRTVKNDCNTRMRAKFGERRRAVYREMYQGKQVKPKVHMRPSPDHPHFRELCNMWEFLSHVRHNLYGPEGGVPLEFLMSIDARRN